MFFVVEVVIGALIPSRLRHSPLFDRIRHRAAVMSKFNFIEVRRCSESRCIDAPVKAEISSTKQIWYCIASSFEFGGVLRISAWLPSW